MKIATPDRATGDPKRRGTGALFPFTVASFRETAGLGDEHTTVLDDHLTGRASAYGPRPRTRLESDARLFGGNGARVHFGRSLTYRAAAVSPVALGAVTGTRRGTSWPRGASGTVG